MELIALWRTLIKRWKMVVIITLVATLTAGVLSKFVLPKQYAGVTTLMVVPQGSAGLYSGLVSGQQLTTTYAALATSATILGQVIHQLHLGIPLTTLAGMVKAKPGANTDLVAITVTSQNSAQAARLANAVGQQTIALVTRAEGQKSLQMVTPATPNPLPVAPDTIVNVGVAFILGLMISSGTAFLLEYLNDSLQSEEEAKRVLGLPVLGIIPTLPAEAIAGPPRRPQPNLPPGTFFSSSRSGRRR